MWRTPWLAPETSSSDIARLVCLAARRGQNTDQRLELACYIDVRRWEILHGILRPHPPPQRPKAFTVIDGALVGLERLVSGGVTNSICKNEKNEIEGQMYLF